MRDLVIVGASGFGKEVAWLVEEINLRTPSWRIIGFVDDASDAQTKSPLGYPVIGTTDTLRSHQGVACAIAIGAPRVRRAVFRKLAPQGFTFPTLVHPTVAVHRTVELGQGVIICANVTLTVEISIAEQVHVNLTTTIGHGARIGAFSTIFPGTNISGDVTLEPGVSLGTGSAVIQGVRIGAGTTVGAAASVVRDLPPNVVAVGVPARAGRALESWE